MVATAIDMSTDYLVWEGLQEIRVYPGPRLDETSFAVQRAKARALSTKELMQGNGAYIGTDRVWLVPQLELGDAPMGFRFKPGDVLHERVDDSDGGDVEWTLIAPADWNKLKQTCRLVCRALAINANLADTVTILRPLIVQGDGAEPVYDWDHAQVLVRDLVCRCQPQEAAPEVHNEVRATRTRFTVVLGQDVELQAQDRLQVTVGETGEALLLSWTAQRGRQRIDVLPEVDCVRDG